IYTDGFVGHAERKFSGMQNKPFIICYFYFTHESVDRFFYIDKMMVYDVENKESLVQMQVYRGRLDAFGHEWVERYCTGGDCIHDVAVGEYHGIRLGSGLAYP